jgi:hypothetical protein
LQSFSSAWATELSLKRFLISMISMKVEGNKTKPNAAGNRLERLFMNSKSSAADSCA